MTDSIREKKEIERSESFHTTAKIISGLLPVAGPVYELFTAVVKPLHEKRREEWVRDVTLRLHKLEKKGKIDLKELQASEEFNTVITKATLLAQQNHQEEKLSALKNIVVHSSIEVTQLTLDLDLTNSFLELINRIGTTHLLMLKAIQSPHEIANQKDMDVDEDFSKDGSFIFKLYPELEENKGRINLFWLEILNMGLVIQNSMRGNNEIEHASQPRLTEIGERFLQFVTDQEI